MIKIQTELKQFLLRLLSFVILFIVISGVIGPYIVSSRLLYGFYFFIYGNLGKMVIISAIIFLLITRRKFHRLGIERYNKINLIFIAASFLLIPLFFQVGNLLLTYKGFFSYLPLSLYAHILLVSIVAFSVIGVFGLSYIRYFVKTFIKELKFCVILSLFYDLAIFQVWKFWPYFSSMVLNSVFNLLSLSFNNVVINPPRTLIVGNFGVQVAQACSGLDSLFLFTSLYLFITILDWSKLDKKKLFLMLVPSSIGLFLVNILRVYLLMLIGILISPGLAINLFHTYAGMILFIIYFLVFWKLFYKWMKMKSKPYFTNND